MLVAVLRLGRVDEKHHGQVLRVERLVLRIFAIPCRAQQARALSLYQVHRTAGAAGGAHQLVEHARQHEVQARLGADVVRDVQELLDGVGHAVHHLTQCAHLAHARHVVLCRPPEIKPCQGLRLRGQPRQAAPHTPPGQPPKRQHQRDEPQGQPYLALQVFVHIRQQLPGGNGHQDVQPLPALRLE